MDKFFAFSSISAKLRIRGWQLKFVSRVVAEGEFQFVYGAGESDQLGVIVTVCDHHSGDPLLLDIKGYLDDPKVSRGDAGHLTLIRAHSVRDFTLKVADYTSKVIALYSTPRTVCGQGGGSCS